jgi:hypothetical protein
VDLFGAQIGHARPLELVKIPGIVVLIIKTQPGAIPGEPTADHFALTVKDLASIRKKLASANIPISEVKDRRSRRVYEQVVPIKHTCYEFSQALRRTISPNWAKMRDFIKTV